MAFDAKVFKFMIASPSDVAKEREIVKELLHEWNTIYSENSKIVVLPASWESNSYPDNGDRAQEIINKQVLDKCDFLVGIFWTKIGTPTGVAESGTIEEINRHISSGKHAMLYFSSLPVELRSVNQEQYRKLEEFRDKIKADNKTLYHEYENLSQFTDDFRRHLHLKLFNDSGDVIKQESYQEIVNDNHNNKLKLPPDEKLSKEAYTLLMECAQSKDGTIMKLRTMSGLTVQTNNKNLIPNNDPRTEAAWEDAVDTLLNLSLIQDRGYKGEIFSLTNRGYRIADQFRFVETITG